MSRMPYPRAEGMKAYGYHGKAAEVVMAEAFTRISLMISGESCLQVQGMATSSSAVLNCHLIRNTA